MYMNINNDSPVYDSPVIRKEDNEIKYLKNVEKSIDLRMDNTYVKLTSSVKENLSRQACSDLLDNDLKYQVSVAEKPVFPASSFITFDSIDSSLNHRFLSEKWSLVSYMQLMKNLFTTGELMQPKIDEVSQETESRSAILNVVRVQVTCAYGRQKCNT